MAVYNGYTVEIHQPAGPTTITVPDVQEITCFVGRQTSTDAWQVSTVTIRAWYPYGFDSPLAFLEADMPIVIYAPNETWPSWAGRITNVTVDYGIPWDGVDTGNEDYLVIEAEGALGVWARGNVTLVNPGVTQMGELLDLFSEPNVHDIPNSPAAQLSYQRVDPIAGLQWAQKAAASVQAIIQDGRSLNSDEYSPTVGFELQSQRSNCEVSFSDTVNDATHRTYSAIVFDGLADNYYTRITVLPEDVAAQSTTVLGATEPYRQLNIDTYNATTAQALSIATGLKAQYGYPLLGIAQIQASTASQHTQNLHTLTAPVSPAPATITQLGDLIGRVVEIDFRGQSYTAVIEGVSLRAELDQSVFTYYLTSTDISAWFTLDSAEFGELDDDRLAYL